MKKHYCFDISFPKIDFDILMLSAKKVKKTHHAHLFVKDNEIELRIYFATETYLGRKLDLWLSQINWKAFGSYTKLKNEKQNDRLQKIDLSSSSLLRTTTGTDQFEGKLEYITLILDSVKFYWDPYVEKLNTAEFYLNDYGFKLVSDYYSLLFGNTEKFDIDRMNGRSDFYTIEHAEFRPEFNFLCVDKRDNKEAKIIKEPKIHFNYKKDVPEKKALEYADTIKILSSFYFRAPIDYVMSRVHLKKYTIEIKKILIKSENDFPGNLWAFRNYWNFDVFMKSAWQKSTLKNIKKISKSIDLFLHALSVDDSSRFLILYSIIEVCMSGTKIKKDEFTFLGNKKEKQEMYNQALAIFLKAIDAEDHAAFKKRWDSIPGILKYKPMETPLTIFLKSQNLKPSEFPITIKELMTLRNNITHGSLDKIAHSELEKANILLHRITGILILNLIGVKEWQLDTDIK